MNQGTYVTYAFTGAHTLVSGQTYHVVLESDGSYDALAISSAAKNSWGFGPETSFADGHAEFKTGTSWLNWDSADDADLQMFFTLQ